MADNSDLLGGGTSSSDSGGDGSSTAPSGSMLSAVSQGVQKATPNGENRDAEEALVKQTWQEYQTARDFDKHARVTMTRDRMYAAGKADPRWASDANIIGSMIDILVSFLYAQNPDVSVRASAKVGTQPDANATAFAETAEIITSRLWRDGKLKKSKKRTVRSSLTVGQGWMKALMYTDKRPCPQIEADIRSQEQLLAQLQSQKDALSSQIDPPADEAAAKLAIQATLTGLQAKEATYYQTGECFDFIRAEDMQVSLDVASITDYLEADWCSNDLYVLKNSLKGKFPDLTDEDIALAAVYYQKQSVGKEYNTEPGMQMGENDSEGAFQKGTPPSSPGGTKGVEFVKVVEMWSKRQGVIFTMIDGVKCWATEPYAPPQATSRFYPYFLDALFEVDGERHPQSLVFRLKKLQDEYSHCRSNQRLMRERSVPGTVFNRGLLSPEDAKKISESTIQEYIGVMPTDPNTPMQNVFAPKPVSTVNPAIYNTEPITADMERISGVQEALQSSTSAQPKTATEAHIQQTGFASRTNADRDSVEDGLTDLAHYTVETAIQEMKPPQAQRIAGPKAFWPFGMDVQDVLTLVEIDIEAGSTGKPDQAGKAQAWSTILPMLEQLLAKIRVLQLSDPPMADSLMALARETLKRLDDRLDIDEFIPQQPPPPPPPPMPPLPQVKVNIQLTGALPPQDVQPILNTADPKAFPPPPLPPPPLPPGAGPPGVPLPPGAIPTTLPGGVPMPPLSAKLPPGALKAGPSIPGGGPK